MSILDDHWNNLSRQLADTTSRLVTAAVEASLARFCKSIVKVLYNEKEASDFLGVSRASLAAWRKAGLIAYAAYPQIRKDELGDIFTYSTDDLLDFREKYIIRPAGARVFEISREVSLMGVEVKKLRAVA